MKLRSLLCLFVLCCAALTCAAARPPNVVIFFTDDQGTLDANCYGSTDLHTPHMDRLAAEGVRFTQAYAHSVCCPSRASLLTGRHPQRVNVNSWTQSTVPGPKGRNLPLEETTLAETFRAAGYATALFGKWHLGGHPDHRPLQQGFDEFFGLLVGFIDNYHHFGGHARALHDLWDGNQEVFLRGSYFPDLIADRAVTFIARHQDEPFFLFYSLNLPHYPEQPAPAYADAYNDLPEPRRSYARAVSTCDHYLGRVLGTLDRYGLTENTIVIFMSDNGHSAEDYQIKAADYGAGTPQGTNYGANGGGGNTGPWIGAKGSFLEGGIRVPAMIRYPGTLPAGAVRDQAITVMDWYPTLLELTGVTPPTELALDGRSVVPAARDATAPETHPQLYWQWNDSWAVREGPWKLIRRGNRGIGQPALAETHLANLADSEPEETNHAAEHPEVVQRLEALHDAWAADVFSVYGP
ncbi:sulfatase-like hydrolase/transferase [Actomonas aquatica]|uniref:Sulfatase-like hydrolase/transferase n=1 Tax=Actomonas aquatica TaxID=2866162 RepID=A0ABZ1C757_9BACT|nr:sulfatase-like hydrolase/transferase [Opitutus sp. WL0086]WRQ87424.1 sulfatase-like hydrolase/transferase [Opitutus sp. WL0086]